MDLVVIPYLQRGFLKIILHLMLQYSIAVDLFTTIQVQNLTNSSCTSVTYRLINSY